ncbi:uncharacterized protein C10orf143 homolog isoform X2 [Mustela putorius furo]|uniref:Uncharacterized protein C10orf143 homolog isoform X2 n=1 Tax=Mustela putorius furo TaxID=9669 RepID=A0A8U0RH52_MUSPF|nr:uncharacterized protein C10orf143 homolog isoform X2 [Mustela putorius furo]
MTSWVGQAGSPRALHLFSGQIAAQRLLTASGRGCGPRSPRSVRSPGPASRGESPGFDTGRSAGSGPSPSGRPASPPARRARDRPRGARAGLARVPGPGRALAGGRAVRSEPLAAEAPPRSAAREGSKLRATGRRGRPFPAAGRGRRLGSRGRRLTAGSGGAAPPARLPEDASAAAGGEAPPAPPHSPAAGRESPARGARRRPGTAPRRCRPEVRPDPRDYSSQRPAPSPQRIGSLRRPSATRRGKTAATALSDQSRQRGGGRSPADRPPVDQAWRDANGLGSSGWARGDRPALETWGPGTEAQAGPRDMGTWDRSTGRPSRHGDLGQKRPFAPKTLVSAGPAPPGLASPASLIGSPGTRGWGRRGHSGVGRRPRGQERPADPGVGPHGHAGAGPVATAEGGGASGSGGRETGMQERRGSRAGVGLPPHKPQRPGVLEW